MDKSFIQNVHDTVSGFLIEEAQVPDVENLFLPGKPCHALTESIYQAYDRLRDFWCVDSISEIEEILTAYDKICQLVGCKMYEYGELFAENTNL